MFFLHTKSIRLETGLKKFIKFKKIKGLYNILFENNDIVIIDMEEYNTLELLNIYKLHKNINILIYHRIPNFTIGTELLNIGFKGYFDEKHIQHFFENVEYFADNQYKYIMPDHSHYIIDKCKSSKNKDSLNAILSYKKQKREKTRHEKKLNSLEIRVFSQLQLGMSNFDISLEIDKDEWFVKKIVKTILTKLDLKLAADIIFLSAKRIDEIKKESNEN